MIAGNEIYYMTPDKQSDTDYVTFTQRIQNDPQETVAESLEAGLTNMKTDSSIVLHASNGMLKSALKEEPFSNQPLKIFSKGSYEFYNIIFYKNSPMSMAFKYSSRKMMQTGRMTRFFL